MKLIKISALLLACASPVSLPAAAAAQAPASSAQQIVDELLATDRAFAAAAANLDTATALSAMFHDDVIMPTPTGFAHGRAEATAALRANPFNLASRSEWTPIRGGLSADGRHGFTQGYMTLRGENGETRLAKYLGYWVRTPQGWRLAAYKRAPRAEGEVSMALHPASLPVRLVPAPADASAAAGYRTSLIAAEQAFSDEAQRIGIGPAFQRNGRADAMNLGNGAPWVVGAQAIGEAVGAAGGAPPTWSADEAIVAASGDLGITFGQIRPAPPIPEGRPASFSFFTIWRRDSVNDRWLYVAE